MSKSLILCKKNNQEYIMTNIDEATKANPFATSTRVEILAEIFPV